jgi:hypothetical protein
MKHKVIGSVIFFFWQVLSFAQNDSLVHLIDSLSKTEFVTCSHSDLMLNSLDSTVSGGGSTYTYIDKKKNLLKGEYKFVNHYNYDEDGQNGTSEYIQMTFYYKDNKLFHVKINESYYNDSETFYKVSLEIDLKKLTDNIYYQDETRKKYLQLIFEGEKFILEDYEDFNDPLRFFKD